MGLDRQVEPGLSRGPYAGWTPWAQADGGDGTTRLLWTHADGSAALWLTDEGGVRASYLYPPGFGLTAADVAAGPGSDTHILWTDTNGTAFLGTIDGSGAVARSVTIGPYPGWTPVAIDDGPDGLTRLLWNSRDGRVGLSQVSADGILRTVRCSSEAGWTAIDVAVGGDGRARIPRVTKTDGSPFASWTRRETTFDRGLSRARRNDGEAYRHRARTGRAGSSSPIPGQRDPRVPVTGGAYEPWSR